MALVLLGLLAPAAADGRVELAPSGELRVDGRGCVVADVILPRPTGVELPGDAAVGETRGVDRWGRQRVVLVDGSGANLSERWIAAGSAVVSPDADGPAWRRLVALEQEARAARRGLWRGGSWRVQDAGQVRGSTGDLVLVQGRVVALGWGGDRLYLNFGEDRRSDFTARVSRADTRAFRRAGIAFEELAGREVRLRGWLFYLGGPMVELSSPAQIEVLP